MKAGRMAGAAGAYSLACTSALIVHIGISTVYEDGNRVSSCTGEMMNCLAYCCAERRVAAVAHFRRHVRCPPRGSAQG